MSPGKYEVDNEVEDYKGWSGIVIATWNSRDCDHHKGILTLPGRWRRIGGSLFLFEGRAC
jgi:hypothetical protein